MQCNIYNLYILKWNQWKSTDHSLEIRRTSLKCLFFSMALLIKFILNFYSGVLTGSITLSEPFPWSSQDWIFFSDFIYICVMAAQMKDKEAYQRLNYLYQVGNRIPNASWCCRYLR